jgi:protein TonB
MQAATHLRSEEQLGLLIAFLAHVAVLGGLALQALQPPAVVEMPERIAVSLAEEVALESAAPELATEAAAATAPTLAPKPKPAPPTIERPRDRVRPSPVPTSRVAPPRPTRTPTPPAQQGGGTRLGDNFLGQGSGERDEDAPVPASQISETAKRSIAQSIAQQLRPHWKPPSGVAVQDIVTILAFELNPDGSLKGTPRMVGQNGVNDANRAQATRHRELAIRAVQLAAPFDLPPEYYNAWKRIDKSRFDWSLSQ